MKENFPAADDDEHHAGRTGASEEIGTEGAGLRERRKRLCRWRGLRCEWQRQEEQGGEKKLAHEMAPEVEERTDAR